MSDALISISPEHTALLVIDSPVRHRGPVRRLRPGVHTLLLERVFPQADVITSDELAVA